MVRLIDADALFTNLDGMMAVSPTGYIHGDTVADMISDAPTIDAVPVRHGMWKKAERNGVWVYSDAYRQCSECNDVIYLAFKMNYCPTCGAKMDAERDEE